MGLARAFEGIARLQAVLIDPKASSDEKRRAEKTLLFAERYGSSADNLMRRLP